MNILPLSFYERDTVEVAHDLIGKLLVRHVDGHYLTGIINETEAYRADDPACHAFKGKTERNAALFGPVGHAYVYFIYGNHFCLNIVARELSMISGGVLIRSIIPCQGIDTMLRNRNYPPTKILTNGPGKITQAVSITKKQQGVDVTKQGELYILSGVTVNPNAIHKTPRIGITAAHDRFWRFVVSPEDIQIPAFSNLFVHGHE